MKSRHQQREFLMTKQRNLPEVVGEVYSLLEPLESEDRAKVVRSAVALFGESAPSAGGAGTSQPPDPAGDGSVFGVKATRWMNQNGINESTILDIFYKNGDQIEVIAADVPGNGKKAKSRNCYLLSGVRSYLESDEPKFTEADAVSLCKHMGCYDQANHSKTRSELGNIVAGTKGSGFQLPAPGLRAAAELIKSISASA